MGRKRRRAFSMAAPRKSRAKQVLSRLAMLSSQGRALSMHCESRLGCQGGAGKR